MTQSRDPYWTLLIDYLKPQWGRVALLALLLLGSIGLQLLNPQIVRRFIDLVGTDRPMRDLTLTAVSFLGVAVVGQAVSLAMTYIGETIAWTATNALRLDLTVHCLKLDMSFHKAHTPGELIERIDGDVSTLAEFFSDMALQLLANALLMLGVLVLLFVEDWRAGLTGVGYVLLTLLALRVVREPLTRAWGESRQAEANLLGFLGERLAGTEDIRASGAEPYVVRQLYALMRRVSKFWIKAKMIQAAGFDATSMVSLAAKVAALAVGAWLFYHDRATLGAVYLIFGYVGQMERPLDSIRRRLDNLRKASASMERVRELMRIQPTVIDRPAPAAALQDGPLAVTFDRVRFQYDDDLGANGPRTVLDDVSFALDPGRVLGLLGRTGSGKTTLTRLLFRLHDPTQGAVRLGQIDLRDLALRDLRRRVGLVTQNVQLFRASVRDNLTLFRPGIDDARLLEALHTLGLDSWYQSLPEGLDTLLQASSQGLSAGQAQLVAFARVLLKDPGLIILDEASSRLDPATEQLVERALDRLLVGRTAIIIAHRLATVQRADEIMILEGGRVIEHGPRASLADDAHSRFYALLQTGLEEALV